MCLVGVEIWMMLDKRLWLAEVSLWGGLFLVIHFFGACSVGTMVSGTLLQQLVSTTCVFFLPIHNHVPPHH